MRYHTLFSLLLLLFFAASSCVFKELKKEKAEAKKLADRNEELEKNVLTRQSEWKLHEASLKKVKDSLSVELAKVISVMPQDLLGARDSLQKELLVVCSTNTALKSENTQLKDTLRAYKSAFRNMFAVSGNKAFRISYNKNTYDCYEVDTKQANLQLYWKDEKGSPLQSLKNLDKMITIKQKALVFASNAGMYTPEHAPQGLFIKDKKMLVKPDRKKEGYGNFYMQPNGIFIIDTNNIAAVIKTEQFNEQWEKSAKFATQSGPMMVIDSLINTNFKQGSDNLNIRNGVGIISPNKAVFVISNQRVNFYDFAEVFRILKCRNALYLDGAISETYLPELGRFQNGGNFGPIIGIIK